MSADTTTERPGAMTIQPRPNRFRDAWVGMLDAARADEEARVSGWVHRRRDHGGLIFIDLRERSGLLQLVFHPETAPAAHAEAHRLRSEDVITVTGTIRRREPENVNPNLPTGEIELAVQTLEILADADTPPFPIDDDSAVNEDLRLRHRSLDLRRAPMQDGDRAAPSGRAHDPRGARCPRLPGDRDAVSDALDARGRA